MKWNSIKAQSKTRTLGLTPIACPAFDTVHERQLNMDEKYLLATKPSRSSRDRQHEHGGLPDEVELVVGIEVMVTFNIATDLDLANGARGHVVDIVLDERMKEHTMQLQYLPLYVLMCIKCTEANFALDGLGPGVLPVASLTQTFVVTTPKGNKTLTSRQQLPITPAYAFTDYRAQAQTIEHCVVDIGKPPYGQLTPFNAYVALSRSRKRDTIRLLCKFEE